MTPDDRDRDLTLRRDDEPPVDDEGAELEAEEEASAEASQRPGPRGRIGGVPHPDPRPVDQPHRPGG
jgi:hypothetical protein